MKNLMFVMMLCVSVVVSAGEENKGKKLSCEERQEQENKKRAEKYRKYAQDYKKYELSKCYKDADEKVLAAAKEVVNLKHKLGAHLDKLADACKENDQEAIKKLHGEKWELERSVHMADNKKRVAQSLSEIDKMLKKYPDSDELKKLKEKISDLSEKYLEITQQIIDQEREKINLGKKIKEAKSRLHKTACDEKKKKYKKKSESSKKKK